MMDLEAIVEKIVEPYLFEAINSDLLDEIAQALADGTGYEIICEICDNELHFKIDSDPPILFLIRSDDVWKQ